MDEPWQCPYCDCYSSFIGAPREDVSAWREAKSSRAYDLEFGDTVSFTARTQIRKCQNPQCGGISIYTRVSETLYEPVGTGDDYTTRDQDWVQIHPRSKARDFALPEYIPFAIRADYAEAFLVSEISPKATVALCRRCVQAMIRDFWGISKANLIKEIDELDKSGKAPAAIEALNAIRMMGNFGAHPERDASLIIDVDPEDAKLSIQIVDSLIKDWYVYRHDFEERQAKLKESIEAKKTKRKTGATPPVA